jgi:glucose-6-phosphate isomerase
MSLSLPYILRKKVWDWVGGRYSVCSAAGAVPISLLYGYDIFEKFLKVRQSMK